MVTNNSSLPQTSEAAPSTELPESTRIVFRVFDSISFRAYDPASGFSATGFDENTSSDHAELLEAHLDPNNRTIITPWISTTRRWLWAVWEMNRRYESRSTYNLMERHDPNIQVAVIDLAACQLERTAGSRTTTLDRGLISRPNSKKKVDTSDEILIYGKIPAAAIVSVWRFEKFFGISGLPRLFSFQMPLHSEHTTFRQVQEQLIAVVNSRSQRMAWKASEEGERCASVVTTFMQDGYSRLEQQIDRMIEPVRRTHSRASKRASRSGTEKHLDSLARGMEALSTGEGPSAGSQVPTPTMNDDTTTGLSHTSVLVETIATPNGGVDASAQRSQGPMYLILPGDVIGYSDPPVFSLYMSLMAHYRLIKHQFSALAPGHTRSDISQVPSFLIRELSHFKQQRSYYEPIIVRIARQKIERFRGIALEFARTVPIGVLDQMDIDQHDWETMQWFMMGSINSWLAPLERKLDGLEENTVPDQKLQAQFGWLGKERKYLWKDYTMVVPSN